MGANSDPPPKRIRIFYTHYRPSDEPLSQPAPGKGYLQTKDPFHFTCLNQPQRQWIAAYLLVVVSVGLLFAPWWGSGKNLAPFDLLEGLLSPWGGGDRGGVPEVHNHFVSDAVTQNLPYALFAHASYQSEGWVGWNPLIFGGVAQHANTMSLPYEGFQQLHRFLNFWPASTFFPKDQRIRRFCRKTINLTSPKTAMTQRGKSIESLYRE